MMAANCTPTAAEHCSGNLWGLHLLGMRGFTLDGQGSELVFTDLPAGGKRRSGAYFYLEDCHETQVLNITASWDWAVQPLGSVAEVVAVNASALSLDYRVKDGMTRAHPDWSDVARLQVSGAQPWNFLQGARSVVGGLALPNGWQNSTSIVNGRDGEKLLRVTFNDRGPGSILAREILTPSSLGKHSRLMFLAHETLTLTLTLTTATITTASASSDPPRGSKKSRK